LTGLITRVVDAAKGVVDIITFPANSEPQHMNNVAKHSDLIAMHCWEFVADDRVGLLEEEVAALRAELETLRSGKKSARSREPDLVG
jgi:uncharacterized small protein (DUF1192 family)